MTITRREWIFGGVILAQQAYIAAKQIRAGEEQRLKSISKPGPKGEACKSCYFFEEVSKEDRRLFGYTTVTDLGLCHFGPPQGGSHINTTRADHWCSHFKDRQSRK